MSLLEKTWLAVAKDSTWVMVLLETTSSKMTIKAFQEFDIPLLQNEDLDVTEVKEWMGRFATGPSRLKIALDSTAVLTDFIDFPRVSGKTLEKHFKDNISNYFDCDKNDYIINFKVAGLFEQDELERIRILLAALPKDLLTRIYGIVGQLGIELASINIACECFMRLFEEMELLGSQDIVFVNVDSVLGHVFLVRRGEVVSYASVNVALSHLFRALKELEKFPGQRVFSWGGGVPLKKMISKSLGFEKEIEIEKEKEKENENENENENEKEQGSGYQSQRFRRVEPFSQDPRLMNNMAHIFPEFAVISPKITEPELESLFIPYENLPFILDLTASDLQRQRKNIALAMREYDKGPGEEGELDSLFSDGGQRASLKRVSDKIREMIQIYQSSRMPYKNRTGGKSHSQLIEEGEITEENSLFREIHVTGIGIASPRIVSIIKSIWQDILPVSFSYPKGWHVPVIQKQEKSVDWLRYPCLLGLILKTHDELN